MENVEFSNEVISAFLAPFKGRENKLEPCFTYSNGQWTVVMNASGYPDDIVTVQYPKLQSYVSHRRRVSATHHDLGVAMLSCIGMVDPE